MTQSAVAKVGHCIHSKSGLITQSESLRVVREQECDKPVMQVQILTSSSPNLETKLPDLLRLSRQVFEPEVDETDYHVPSKAPQLQIREWRERMSLQDSAFFYVESIDIKHSGGAPTLLGYFFAHPRAPSKTVNTDQRNTYHIYLAAVHPSARGKGIFLLLLEATKVFARKADYNTLTIATIPDKFKRMYYILSKAGSGWELLEEVYVNDVEGLPKRKVLMKMPLTASGEHET